MSNALDETKKAAIESVKPDVGEYLNLPNTRQSVVPESSAKPPEFKSSLPEELSPLEPPGVPQTPEPVSGNPLAPPDTGIAPAGLTPVNTAPDLSVAPLTQPTQQAPLFTNTIGQRGGPSRRDFRTSPDNLTQQEFEDFSRWINDYSLTDDAFGRVQENVAGNRNIWSRLLFGSDGTLQSDSRVDTHQIGPFIVPDEGLLGTPLYGLRVGFNLLWSLGADATRAAGSYINLERVLSKDFLRPSPGSGGIFRTPEARRETLIGTSPLGNTTFPLAGTEAMMSGVIQDSSPLGGIRETDEYGNPRYNMLAGFTSQDVENLDTAEAGPLAIRLRSNYDDLLEDREDLYERMNPVFSTIQRAGNLIDLVTLSRFIVDSFRVSTAIARSNPINLIGKTVALSATTALGDPLDLLMMRAASIGKQVTSQAADVVPGAIIRTPQQIRLDTLESTKDIRWADLTDEELLSTLDNLESLGLTRGTIARENPAVRQKLTEMSGGQVSTPEVYTSPRPSFAQPTTIVPFTTPTLDAPAPLTTFRPGDLADDFADDGTVYPIDVPVRVPVDSITARVDRNSVLIRAYEESTYFDSSNYYGGFRKYLQDPDTPFAYKRQYLDDLDSFEQTDEYKELYQSALDRATRDSTMESFDTTPEMLRTFEASGYDNLEDYLVARKARLDELQQSDAYWASEGRALRDVQRALDYRRQAARTEEIALEREAIARVAELTNSLDSTPVYDGLARRIIPTNAPKPARADFDTQITRSTLGGIIQRFEQLNLPNRIAALEASRIGLTYQSLKDFDIEVLKQLDDITRELIRTQDAYRGLEVLRDAYENFDVVVRNQRFIQDFIAEFIEVGQKGDAVTVTVLAPSPGVAVDSPRLTASLGSDDVPAGAVFDENPVLSVAYEPAVSTPPPVAPGMRAVGWGQVTEAAETPAYASAYRNDAFTPRTRTRVEVPADPLERGPTPPKPKPKPKKYTPKAKPVTRWSEVTATPPSGLLATSDLAAQGKVVDIDLQTIQQVDDVHVLNRTMEQFQEVKRKATEGLPTEQAAKLNRTASEVGADIDASPVQTRANIRQAFQQTYEILVYQGKSGMTKKQLLNIAKEFKVPKYTRYNKDDLYEYLVIYFEDQITQTEQVVTVFRGTSNNVPDAVDVPAVAVVDDKVDELVEYYEGGAKDAVASAEEKIAAEFEKTVEPSKPPEPTAKVPAKSRVKAAKKPELSQESLNRIASLEAKLDKALESGAPERVLDQIYNQIEKAKETALRQATVDERFVAKSSEGLQDEMLSVADDAKTKYTYDTYYDHDEAVFKQVDSLLRTQSPESAAKLRDVMERTPPEVLEYVANTPSIQHIYLDDDFRVSNHMNKVMSDNAAGVYYRGGRTLVTNATPYTFVHEALHGFFNELWSALPESARYLPTPSGVNPNVKFFRYDKSPAIVERMQAVMTPLVEAIRKTPEYINAYNKLDGPVGNKLRELADNPASFRANDFVKAVVQGGNRRVLGVVMADLLSKHSTVGAILDTSNLTLSLHKLQLAGITNSAGKRPALMNIVGTRDGWFSQGFVEEFVNYVGPNYQGFTEAFLKTGTPPPSLIPVGDNSVPFDMAFASFDDTLTKGSVDNVGGLDGSTNAGREQGSNPANLRRLGSQDAGVGSTRDGLGSSTISVGGRTGDTDYSQGRPSRGQPPIQYRNLDQLGGTNEFGPGLYTTTDYQRAKWYAQSTTRAKPGVSYGGPWVDEYTVRPDAVIRHHSDIHPNYADLHRRGKFDELAIINKKALEDGVQVIDTGAKDYVILDNSVLQGVNRRAEDALDTPLQMRTAEYNARLASELPIDEARLSLARQGLLETGAQYEKVLYAEAQRMFDESTEQFSQFAQFSSKVKEKVRKASQSVVKYFEDSTSEVSKCL